MRLSALFRAPLRPTLLLPLLAVAVTLAMAFYAEFQNREIHLQSQRNDVLNSLAVVRARVEGYINANIQLVQGLVAVVATEPGLDQVRFAAIGVRLFEQPNQLSNVAAAPGLVVSMVYPLEGNEAVLGLDYTQNPQQRHAALRVRDEGRLVLAGPVDLVQGGTGFIARYPVFVRGEDGSDVFWGITSAVIDAEVLYRESGLYDAAETLGIAVAIGGRDGQAQEGTPFFGDAAILSGDPLFADILLPNGSWRMWAVPAGGWSASPPNAWIVRLGMVVAGGLLIIPMFLAVRLNEERRRRIIDQKRREDELARLSRRLELALSVSQVGVWEHNLTTGALTWDDRMFEIYGVGNRRDTGTYRQWQSLLHPDDREQAEREFAHTAATGERYVSTFRIITPRGETRYIRAIGALYRDAGAYRRIIGVNWDATADARLNDALMRAKTQAEAKNVELEAAKARIEHNALHDSLTGLPNRRYLDQMLENDIGKLLRRGGEAALLHIDLDRFKQINDTLGHAAGDAMLVHASAVLRTCVAPEDFVARIGGDEFVVLSTRTADRTDLGNMAERIIAEMRKPVSYKGHECRFGVSVGIASARDGGVSARQLLINADIALYRAKRLGRGRFELFSEAMQAEIVTSKRVADEILCALDADEFIAHYQPQFDAQTLDLVGVEALARWQHPVRGLLAPDAFMDIAEELNVTAALDRIILERTLADRVFWAEHGLDLQRLSVNVSARRLHDQNLIASLEALDLPPGRMSFELVESIYLDESDDIVAFNIERIKALGIAIEIDDFGTGYASIVSLLKLSPARLKIDRQLIAPITSSEPQRQLVGSIIDIGRSLGIEVVAEGVETRDHIALLREMGCTTLQGYALARPMPREALLTFARARAWRAA